MNLTVNHEDLVRTDKQIIIEPGVKKWTITLHALDAGHAELNIILIFPDKVE